EPVVAAQQAGSSCAADAEPATSPAGTAVPRACGSRQGPPGEASGRSSARRSGGGAGPAPQSAGAAECCGPAAAGTAARSGSSAPPAGSAVHSAPSFASTAPAHVSQVRSPFFSQRLLDHVLLQDRLGQQLLQLGVLRLQRLELLR